MIQILRGGVSFEALVPGINLSNGLLETLLKRPPDCHDFTDGLHGGTDLPVDLGGELGQVPFRDFGDNVVQRGFKAGGSGLRDGIWKLG